MSASASRALAAAVLLSACSREIDVRPFHIEAFDGAGTGLETTQTEPTVVLIDGMCARLSPTAITIDNANYGLVTIRFDNSADRDVQFPEHLNGQIVIAELNISPASRSPEGPLPMPALRISVGEHARFLMGEGAFVNSRGEPGLVSPVQPRTNPELAQLPVMEVVADGLAFEPSRCGDIYYDKLRVRGARTLVLDFGHHATLKVQEQFELPDWTVHHVASFHRPGTITERGGGMKTPKDCKPEGRSWVQAAAWR